MEILLWVVFGFLVGAVARMISPGRDPGGTVPGGFVATALVGVAGALVGGFSGRALGLSAGSAAGFSPAGFVTSVLGAVVLLFVWQAIAARTVTPA